MGGMKWGFLVEGGNRRECLTLAGKKLRSPFFSPPSLSLLATFIDGCGKCFNGNLSIIV